MAVLPKKSALTDYSYRLSHDHQRAFLAALDVSSSFAASPTGFSVRPVHVPATPRYAAKR